MYGLLFFYTSNGKRKATLISKEIKEKNKNIEFTKQPQKYQDCFCKNHTVIFWNPNAALSFFFIDGVLSLKC